MQAFTLLRGTVLECLQLLERLVSTEYKLPLLFQLSSLHVVSVSSHSTWNADVLNICG